MLWEIARIVHEADLDDGRYDAPEARGLDILIRGLSLTHNDRDLLALSCPLPLQWNAILRDAGGHGFFVDAPVVVLPVSWQDTGFGAFTVAVAALALGFGPLGDASARRLATVALLCGLGAFLVDVYLY